MCPDFLGALNGTHRMETQDYEGGGQCTNVRTDSTQPSGLGQTAPYPLV